MVEPEQNEQGDGREMDVKPSIHREGYVGLVMECGHYREWPEDDRPELHIGLPCSICKHNPTLKPAPSREQGGGGERRE